MSEASFQLTPGLPEADLVRRATRLTLDSYDFNEPPSFDRATFARLADGELVDTGGNALIFGGYGTGKTHLSYALASSAAQKGKTVRIIDDSGLRHGDNRLLEPLNWAESVCGVPQTYTGPRRDLLHCDLLVISELPRDQGEGATLALILLDRFKARRSTLITTTFRADQIVDKNLLPCVELYKTSPRCWPVNNSTERLLLLLNIGFPTTPDRREFDAVRDCIYVPADGAELFNKFNIAPLSWIRDGKLAQTFEVGEPGAFRDWHLFAMTQRSYRHHPKHWMGQGIAQSNWPPETVAWLKELGPDYRPTPAE